MVGFKGSLELGSITEREREALLSRFTSHEISLMNEVHMYRDQSSTTEVGGFSNSEGAPTMSERLCVRGS